MNVTPSFWDSRSRGRNLQTPFFDCHMTIRRTCAIAASIRPNVIGAAPSNAACGDIIALPHPTQVIVQNVSRVSCNTKLRELPTPGEEIRGKVLTNCFPEESRRAKCPRDRNKDSELIFLTCYNETSRRSLCPEVVVANEIKRRYLDCRLHVAHITPPWMPHNPWILDLFLGEEQPGAAAVSVSRFQLTFTVVIFKPLTLN